MEITVSPLSAGLLADFYAFFDRVAFTDHPQWSGCYCCYYHHDPRERPWEKRTREENRQAAGELIRRGTLRGYLAYHEGHPVGWCNANDRTGFALLAADPGLPDAGRQKIGSIVCFLIAPALRGQGIAGRLLERVGADFAAGGYDCLEAYPRRAAAGSAKNYHGPAAMYEKAGFTTYRELPSYRIVRKPLAAPPSPCTGWGPGAEAKLEAASAPAPAIPGSAGTSGILPSAPAPAVRAGAAHSLYEGRPAGTIESP
jgi:GNAT superfamily N-acetyltransferase